MKVNTPPLQGPRLKKARERADLSREQLAEAMQPTVSYQAVRQWEEGIIRPRKDKVALLAQILGVTQDWLRGEGPDDLAADPSYTRPAKKPADRLDRGLMADVILALHTFLETEGLRVAPEIYSELVFTTYDWAEDERAKGNRRLDLTAIERFIRIAAKAK